jgi:hypothetical protein
VNVRLFQYPLKSGWPSAVRGITQFFDLLAEAASALAGTFAAGLALVFTGVADDWADKNAGTKSRNATPEALDKGPKYFFIGTASSSTRTYLLLAILAVK